VIQDPLTGLNNRRYLAQKLRQALDAASGQLRRLSLLAVDLDGFKVLNDERGHDAGDRALIETGESIKQYLRDSDALARVGGDEVMVVLPGATAQQAQAIARRLLQTLPLALGEKLSVSLTCSIGIATIDGQDKTGEVEFIRLADQALLAAKRRGKSRAVHASEV
jgi:two-component system cell cycle response regulator